MITKEELANMSKEELMEYVSSLEMESENSNKKISSLEDKFEKLSDKYDKLEQEFAKLEKERNELLKKIEAKTAIIKLNNHNNFYSKAESSIEDVVLNEAEETVKKKPGRKKGSKNFANLDLESLVSETIIEQPESFICPKCGNELTKFGEDISYKIKKIPTKIEVIKVIRPVYKCKNCSDVISQSLNDNKYPHSVCTPSLAANIIDAKFNLAVPLYRYSNYLNACDIPLSPMDLSNYVLRTDELLKPVYNHMLSALKNTDSNVIFSDETPIKVIGFKKENRSNGYIFVYITSYYDYPIYIYSFNLTRKTTELQDLLNDFKGYLVCDGYTGYDILKEQGIKIQRCFAHIRRNFYDIVKTLPEKLMKNSHAAKMVKKIDKLFHEEEEFVRKKLTPSEIYKQRHTDKYIAIVEDIYAYLHELNPEEGTQLAKAVNYFLNVEEESKTFLLDGHIPLSNNIAERAIKPFVICRKNFLFAKTTAGAESSARLFSLLQTAKANTLNPEAYLEYVIENVGKVDIDLLMPWAEKLPDNLKIM